MTRAGVYRHQHPSKNHLPQSTVQSRVYAFLRFDSIYDLIQYSSTFDLRCKRLHGLPRSFCRGNISSYGIAKRHPGIRSDPEVSMDTSLSALSSLSVSHFTLIPLSVITLCQYGQDALFGSVFGINTDTSGIHL